MKFFSPAKLNVFLRVLGKRPDGFHELFTRYQAINFGDTLELELSSQDRLECNHNELNKSSNLIWKSTQLFRSITHIHTPVCWRLHKQIPLQAGLGGGSSNAATALFALNLLFSTNIPVTVLQTLSQDIGMDVPFFFSCGAALGTGRGEIIENTSPIDQGIVLYLSSPGVSTRQAFSSIVSSDYGCYKNAGNDLEVPVFRLRPDLKEKKELLERIWSPFQGKVGLSGTGATLFVCYPKYVKPNLLIKTSGGIPVTPLLRGEQWYSFSG